MAAAPRRRQLRVRGRSAVPSRIYYFTAVAYCALAVGFSASSNPDILEAAHD